MRILVSLFQIGTTIVATMDIPWFVSRVLVWQSVFASLNATSFLQASAFQRILEFVELRESGQVISHVRVDCFVGFCPLAKRRLCGTRLLFFKAVHDHLYPYRCFFVFGVLLHASPVFACSPRYV